MAQIFAFREDRLGFKFSIDNKAVLGRSPECDLLLFDRSASRQHAEIFKREDKYYIADLASTNGTLVNDKPITMQTPLEPFDSIKIGQELFIFEPKLEVIVGPAPSALIIEGLADEAMQLLSAPVNELAARVSSDDHAALMELAFQCCSQNNSSNIQNLHNLVLDYLKNRFGMTYMSILWPSKPPTNRLTSFITSHDDKRLLLSQFPFLRATRDHEALLWPTSIDELYFHEGQRNVHHNESPALIGPLYANNGGIGMLYMENTETPFNENDLCTFSALLLTICPLMSHMVDARHLAEGRALPTEDDHSPSYNFISSDDQVRIIYSTAAQMALTKSSILINGESGTGKTALSRYIHNASPRKKGRLLHVTLSNIPASEIDRILFGQSPEPGHDFGPVGFLEQADGGTLFLQHVEYLPPSAQKTLLMAIEEGLFYPLQATRATAVDLRVVSSTSIDLWAKVEVGHFREDLYSRLNQVSISMPPLRDIKSDIDDLATTFMGKAAKEMGLSFNGADPAAIECLKAYNWPGNLSELKKEAGLLVLFSRDGRVVMEDLPLHLKMAPDAFLGDTSERPTIAEAERYTLIRALARCSGNLEHVAKLLGQTPEETIIKMRAYGLDPIDYQVPIEMQMPKGPGQTSVPTS